LHCPREGCDECCDVRVKIARRCRVRIRWWSTISPDVDAEAYLLQLRAWLTAALRDSGWRSCACLSTRPRIRGVVAAQPIQFR
jgi:hypothetical protein